VLILGAGFSRSLSEQMPLTDDLGGEVMPRVIASSGFSELPLTFKDGNFETWLSRIAEDQPDLSLPENLRNRYVFQLCSEALAEVLSERVALASDEVLANEGLQDFLHALHARQATLITFNQDVLVELAVNNAAIASWDRDLWERVGAQPKIGRSDVLNDLPPLPPGRIGFDPPRPSLRLLKLHGSTHWYWQPDDTSGATVATWLLPGEGAEATPERDRDERERELPGRVPMIVPPAAAKSSFYKAPLLRKLWQDARKALAQGTGTLSLLGYSMPITDLVTIGMLRETVGDAGLSGATPITVVNPDPQPVLHALEVAGVSSGRIAVAESVEAFATEYTARAARELAADLREVLVADGTTHMLVGSSLADCQKVKSVRAGEAGVVPLEAMEEVDPYRGTNLSATGSPPPCTVDDLRAVLDARPDLHSLSVVSPSTRARPVLAAAEYRTNVGVGVGDWQVLVTPPSRPPV
jgi:hypothetical protein